MDIPDLMLLKGIYCTVNFMFCLLQKMSERDILRQYMKNVGG